MENQHKQILGDFRRETKFKSAADHKAVTLDSIILSSLNVRKEYSVVPDSISKILDSCHPMLFFHYILKFEILRDSRLPAGFTSGMSFFKDVNNRWRKICQKRKIWNYGSLKVFSDFNELCNLIDEVVGVEAGNSYWHDGDYIELEQKLWEIKQAQLDHEAEERQKEEERLKKEKEELDKQNKHKEAQQVADNLKRKQQAKSSAQTAEFYRSLQEQEGHPYHRTESPAETKTANRKSSNHSSTNHPSDMDPFAQSSSSILDPFDPFATSDESLLAAPFPEPADMQILFKFDKGQTSVVFGKSVQKGHIVLRRFGLDNYICIENNYDADNKVVASQLMKFYQSDRFVLLNLGDNASQNPILFAYPIANIADKA